MPAFPTWIKRRWRDLEDAPESAVIRSEMERGVPKYRRFTSDVMVKLPTTIFFTNSQQATDFESWFYSSTGADSGVAVFDLMHPRPGVGLVQARILNGDIGSLKTSSFNWAVSERSFVFEYLRATI